jgi:hypothetical protein
VHLTQKGNVGEIRVHPIKTSNVTAIPAKIANVAQLIRA